MNQNFLSQPVQVANVSKVKKKLALVKIKFKALKGKFGLKMKPSLRPQKDLRWYLTDPFKQTKDPVRILREYFAQPLC